jgi:ferric-dicitrate binding protein FerR (iron transport regulator)
MIRSNIQKDVWWIMKRLIFRARLLCMAFVAIFLSALHITPVLSGDYQEKIDAQRREIVTRLETYTQRFNRSRAALIRAKKAEALSRDLKDMEALPIAEQARRNAEAAIRRLKLLHRAEIERLKRLDNASRSTFRLNSRHLSYVSRFRGTVQRTGGKPLDAKLEPGDTITTGRDGYFEVSFLGGSTMTLGPNTTLRVLDDDERAYYQGRGKIFRAIRCVQSRNICKFRYSSPGATLAVRGTAFETVVGDDKSTMVRVLEGAVELIPNRKDAKPITVKAGNQITVGPDGKIVSRQALSKQAHAPWWEF